MKEYGWTAGNGNEIKVVVNARAEITKREILADGSKTGTYETNLIETLNSTVYLDGNKLGNAIVKPIKCDNPSIVAVLNGKIGLTQENLDSIRMTEKTAAEETRNTEEIQNYLTEKKAAEESANKTDADYIAHTAMMNRAMGN